MIRFLPRETKFFDLFAELSTAMNEGARLLRSILEDPQNLESRSKRCRPSSIGATRRSTPL